MICGQSLQAFAFLLANASQAGSVDTGLASGVENLLATSFVTGVDGTESEISTFLQDREREKNKPTLAESCTLSKDSRDFTFM